jgi:hypothetical protein
MHSKKEGESGEALILMIKKGDDKRSDQLEGCGDLRSESPRLMASRRLSLAAQRLI